jgi:hypothetical protein
VNYKGISYNRAIICLIKIEQIKQNQEKEKLLSKAQSGLIKKKIENIKAN